LEPPCDYVGVLISSDLYREIEKNIEGKGFSSVQDFVNYAVHIALGKRAENEFTEEDSEAVTARLKALGYI
jgi:Arc/MetJ-type ribon-helix-helix transcriptional regulator